MALHNRLHLKSCNTIYNCYSHLATLRICNCYSHHAIISDRELQISHKEVCTVFQYNKGSLAIIGSLSGPPSNINKSWSIRLFTLMEGC